MAGCTICGARARGRLCAACRERYAGATVVVERARPARAPRERVYKASVTIGGRSVPVKRMCRSQRFAPRSARALGCAWAPRPRPPGWWVARRGDRAGVPCYRTRGELLRAFLGWNLDTVEPWGGLDQPGSRGEFDAVNERFGLRGRRRVTTLRGALEACAPRGAPWCLDRIDLETLNETAPARFGRPFELPPVEQEWDWGPPPAAGADDVPF